MEGPAPRLDVVGLPLNPTVRHKLQCAGFRTTAELAAVAGPVELATGMFAASCATGHHSRLPAGAASACCCRSCPLRNTNTHLSAACAPAHLAAEAQLTHEEALLVLKLAAPQRVQPGGGGGAAASHAVSARQIFEREAAAKRILTFAADLDGILGGGVETGAITEFWWVLGVGCCARSVLRTLPACGEGCMPGVPPSSIHSWCWGDRTMPPCLRTQPLPNINNNSRCGQARHAPADAACHCHCHTATLVQWGAWGGQDPAGHAAGAGCAAARRLFWNTRRSSLH